MQQPMQQESAKALAARVLARRQCNKPATSDATEAKNQCNKRGEIEASFVASDWPANAAGPTDLHHCGGGVFHQLVAGGEWLCSFCSPRVGVPATVFVVPGGVIPDERATDTTPTAQPVDVAAMTENALEHFTERAAIAEFDGGLPRTEAERQAAQRVFEYRLIDWPGHQWGVLLVPSGGIDTARQWCRERFGERVVDVRPYRPGGKA